MMTAIPGRPALRGPPRHRAHCPARPGVRGAAADGQDARQPRRLPLDASGPFYGYNRPGARPSQGVIQSWWLQGMLGGLKNTYDSIKAFSETDFRGDLARFDRPTLIVHGTDDQVVPIDVGGRASAKLVPHARFIEYLDAPHGLTESHKDRLNADLLAFLKE